MTVEQLAGILSDMLKANGFVEIWRADLEAIVTARGKVATLTDDQYVVSIVMTKALCWEFTGIILKNCIWFI